MPSWTELINTLESIQDDKDKGQWLMGHFQDSLKQISKLRENRNVLFYGSAFLQKPTASPVNLQITHEDINGFMSTIHGMDCSKGLVLIMHTPGGVTNATETIVSY